MKNNEHERRILERVRSFGSNLSLEGGKLKVINPEKLPDTAIEFVKRNSEELVDFLSESADREERQAIMEHDGGLNEAVTEYLNRLLYAKPPKDISAEDWTFFVNKACKIVDDHFNGGNDAGDY